MLKIYPSTVCIPFLLQRRVQKNIKMDTFQTVVSSSSASVSMYKYQVWWFEHKSLSGHMISIPDFTFGLLESQYICSALRIKDICGSLFKLSHFKKSSLIFTCQVIIHAAEQPYSKNTDTLPATRELLCNYEL